MSGLFKGTGLRRAVAIAGSAVLLAGSLATGALAQSPAAGGGEVTIMTYFSADLGEKALAEDPRASSRPSTGTKVNIAPIDHENFKTGDPRPAGRQTTRPTPTPTGLARAPRSRSRTGRCCPSTTCGQPTTSTPHSPPGMVAAASTYDGKKYLIPFGYHYAGMFFNPKVMADRRRGHPRRPGTSSWPPAAR